ncbi:hypothetical protein JS87_22350 [Vibrio vulnificus]|uniref:hypothetical protein n=1 Tax=Vibrio vulnificus TaxID=672 RepID=UPI000506A58F|nr:hypothetical protein [Vibrio vulnificus]ELK2254874.1 hypothetical protein [Vibrio vulnificus]KFK48287.1 hypothetical protein JS87_22350 [Vibrio vulnificus]RZQ17841.1 hypothetical protein D8T50_11520 [Vibrio vulnificus]HAS6228038.1 hypothetical protein [Vibrio vulnificus]
MKKLIFQELIIVSDLEKSAGIFQFGPKRNLILGASNKVGKTSLCTTLMWSIGCNVEFPPNWKKLGIKTILKFQVDSATYYIKRSDKKLSIIFPSGSEKEYDKVTGDYSADIGDILFSPLYMKIKGGSPSPGVPSAQFLASFIHSDSGWGELFKSFKDLNMYSPSEKKYVLEYFLGIRDVSFFTKRKARVDLEGNIEASKQKLNRIMIVDNDIKSLLNKGESENVNVFDIDPLLEERSFVLANIIKLKSEKYDVNKRIGLIERAEHELFEDYQFATNNVEGRLITCPTCGVIHENDIVNRFNIINERDSLKNHRMSLLKDLNEISEYISREQRKIDEINAKISVNERFYNLSRPTEKDIYSHGTETVIESVFSELVMLENKSIARFEEELASMPKFSTATSKYRDNASNIRELFSTSLIESLHDFNVLDANEELVREDPYAKIHVSGSDISRTTLGYYKTLNDFKLKNCDSVILPFVCDSPMQQEQDDKNIDSVVDLIQAWSEQQFFLFGKDYPSYEKLKRDPDTKLIYLENNRRILSKEDYPSLASYWSSSE